MTWLGVRDMVRVKVGVIGLGLVFVPDESTVSVMRHRSSKEGLTYGRL